MIKLENIDVTFTQGKKVVKAVRNVSVDVEDGGYLWNYRI